MYPVIKARQNLRHHEFNLSNNVPGRRWTSLEDDHRISVSEQVFLTAVDVLELATDQKVGGSSPLGCATLRGPVNRRNAITCLSAFQSHAVPSIPVRAARVDLLRKASEIESVDEVAFAAPGGNVRLVMVEFEFVVAGVEGGQQVPDDHGDGGVDGDDGAFSAVMFCCSSVALDQEGAGVGGGRDDLAESAVALAGGSA
ncbi:hypothetical protein ABZU75_36150 [Streptosporangium sp. NPDC005286]|uniref:hypothetical protein n=1 Tax=Streptosporangium sp. NPDC005286 TaxID=3154463 RepID=UPI0033A87A95